MEVAGEAANADEVYEILRTNNFDIAIIDINMPGKSGLDLLKDLKIQNPELPVLILSMYAEEQYGIRALKSGASGYLKKASAPNELVKAIRKIDSGGKYINASLAEKLADTVNASYDKLPHESLSDRESELCVKLLQVIG
jgi:DNA-binding NarL/FixJ family response regulator